MNRLRRWWRSVRPDACPICGTRAMACDLAVHLNEAHTPSELKAYLEEADR